MTTTSSDDNLVTVTTVSFSSYRISLPGTQYFRRYAAKPHRMFEATGSIRRRLKRTLQRCMRHLCDRRCPTSIDTPEWGCCSVILFNKWSKSLSDIWSNTALDSISYSAIRRYSVVRPMPNILATSVGRNPREKRNSIWNHNHHKWTVIDLTEKYLYMVHILTRHLRWDVCLLSVRSLIWVAVIP